MESNADLEVTSKSVKRFIIIFLKISSLQFGLELTHLNVNFGVKDFTPNVNIKATALQKPIKQLIIVRLNINLFILFLVLL